jgi:hypothetical protein
MSKEAKAALYTTQQEFADTQGCVAIVRLGDSSAPDLRTGVPKYSNPLRMHYYMICFEIWDQGKVVNYPHNKSPIYITC